MSTLSESAYSRRSFVSRSAQFLSLAGTLPLCATACADTPATAPSAHPATAPSDLPTDAHIDQAGVDKLLKKWRDMVAPHRAEVQKAAEVHYQVISALQKEQHRLIDEADKIQRAIDQLEKEYQDMTTPHPPAP